MIAWIRMAWRAHGTKITGIVTTVYSGFVAVVALLAATPAVQTVVAPRTFAYLLIGNAVLGLITTKRGFSNTRNATSPTT